MMDRPRSSVGIYDRPPFFRRRSVWVPALIALIVIALWLVFFVFW